MSLLTLILILIAVGIFLYCINQFVPMDSNVKTILNVVVILVLVVFLLKAFGIWHRMDAIHF